MLPTTLTRRRRRLGAVGLAAALVLPLVSVPAAAEPTWTPTLTVSQTVGLEDGDTITVTGAGYDPTANVGTRPPFPGQPNGVYVVFGRFDPTWRPSAGAPSSARQVISQKWAVPPETAGPMMADPAFVPLADDGTFTATLAVTEAEGTGDYAVVTYPAGGAVNATQERHVPVSFDEPAPLPEFTDVADDATHAGAIAELVERRITAGRTATTFEPAAPVTRGQIATFLARAEGLVPLAPEPAPAPASRPFPDVVTEHAHAAAIAALVDRGIVQGYADGSFRPNASVRRDQIASMVAAWLDLAPTTTAAFDDVHAGAHAGAVNALAEVNVALGSNGRYQPGATLRRDQMASFLVRGLHHGEDGGTVGTGGQVLSATPTTDLDPDGTTVTVRGRGYDDTVGVYVALCVDNGPAVAPGPCVGGADQTGEAGTSKWVSSNPPSYAAGLTTPYGPGGSFEVQILARAGDGDVDCTASGVTCVVATRADHLQGGNRRQDARIEVSFAS